MANCKIWQEIYDRLYRVFGDCRCQLHHENPFQLLAAVMLSAQCRDDRVNVVTEELFALAPTPEKMAALPVEKIAEIVKPCGLFRHKSGNLKACAETLVRDHDGKVPPEMEKLVTLPGIGRKSANVILGDAFGIPGFPVDTHVNRVLNRLGLVEESDPVKIERIVNGKVAPRYWTNFSHILILHGRTCCPAARPKCENCVLADLCRTGKEGKR